MTVGDWLSARSSTVPPSLRARVLALLGDGVAAPAAEAETVFIDAAARALAEILEGRRFARDAAPDLLAVDALMTYAYEHAGDRGASAQELERIAGIGASRIGQLANANV